MHGRVCKYVGGGAAPEGAMRVGVHLGMHRGLRVPQAVKGQPVQLRQRNILGTHLRVVRQLSPLEAHKSSTQATQAMFRAQGSRFRV